MASLEVSGITKRFGSEEVLSNISLEIEDGEFTALVGPSGCGKSTLLRMIAGLEDLTEGTIRMGGQVVDDLQPKDRDIAMVFQNYALYPNKTVAANIGFPLKMKGVARSVIVDKVEETARILGMEDLLKRYPSQLSGGQRQRVAMGRAIVRDPQLFLFDEPLSNLDAKLRVKMRAEIKELHQRLKTTTIYVTHDQIEAMTMADKVVVMRAGIIEQIGAPLELYDKPSNKFVAGFIGSPSMNFLDGQIEVDDSGTTFRTTEGLAVQLEFDRPRETGIDITFGIRPEHLLLDTSERAGYFPMKILVVEPTGAETTIVVRSGAHELTVTKQGRHDLRPEMTVWLKPVAEHLHFFATNESAIYPLKK